MGSPWQTANSVTPQRAHDTLKKAGRIPPRKLTQNQRIPDLAFSPAQTIDLTTL